MTGTDGSDRTEGHVTGERRDASPEVGTIEGTGPQHVYDLDLDEAPSTGVVTAVSAAANRSPASLKPLYRVVDTDALDALLGRRGGTSASRAARVTFQYEEYVVTVNAERTVVVHS